MAYQDEVRDDGTVASTGYRDCGQRYEIIRKELESLRRPFTVLDLGASQGYFSIRLTQDFGARVVAVDRLKDIHKATGKVAAIRQKDLTVDDIFRLGTFDVVLGLSFLHHQKDWCNKLAMMAKITRSALIIETPNSNEKLRQAVARHDLGLIQMAVKAVPGMRHIGAAPAVWNSTLQRGLFMMRRHGLPVTGRVFSGSQNNSLHTARFAEELEHVLGYQPFPGSLNVRTPRAFRLGGYAAEYVDALRGRGGRRGGDYQVWHARVDGYDGPAHVMRPGLRGHGRKVLEVWAPVKLKDELKLKDGDRVTLRIGA